MFYILQNSCPQFFFGAQLLKQRNHESFLNRFPLQVITMKRMGERKKNAKNFRYKILKIHQLNLPIFHPAPWFHIFNSRGSRPINRVVGNFKLFFKSSNILYLHYVFYSYSLDVFIKPYSCVDFGYYLTGVVQKLICIVLTFLNLTANSDYLL